MNKIIKKLAGLLCLANLSLHAPTAEIVSSVSGNCFESVQVNGRSLRYLGLIEDDHVVVDPNRLVDTLSLYTSVISGTVGIVAEPMAFFRLAEPLNYSLVDPDNPDHVNPNPMRLPIIRNNYVLEGPNPGYLLGKMSDTALCITQTPNMDNQGDRYMEMIFEVDGFVTDDIQNVQLTTIDGIREFMRDHELSPNGHFSVVFHNIEPIYYRLHRNIDLSDMYMNLSIMGIILEVGNETLCRCLNPEYDIHNNEIVQVLDLLQDLPLILNILRPVLTPMVPWDDRRADLLEPAEIPLRRTRSI